MSGATMPGDPTETSSVGLMLVPVGGGYHRAYHFAPPQPVDRILVVVDNGSTDGTDRVFARAQCGWSCGDGCGWPSIRGTNRMRSRARLTPVCAVQIGYCHSRADEVLVGTVRRYSLTSCNAPWPAHCRCQSCTPHSSAAGINKAQHLHERS